MSPNLTPHAPRHKHPLGYTTPRLEAMRHPQPPDLITVLAAVTVVATNLLVRFVIACEQRQT